MTRIAAWAVETPSGDAAATRRALSLGQATPGVLPDELLPTLIRLGQQALSAQPHRPDLLLLASAKGDLPLWVSSLLQPPTAETPAVPLHGGLTWLAHQLSLVFGCPAYAVSGACASGPVALAEAGRAILSGSARCVLVLGGDRLAPFVIDGFAGLKATDAHSCRPFAADRGGTVLSETAAAVVIDDGSGPLYLQGWGQSLDAHHLTGPCRDGAGLLRACVAACRTSEPPRLMIAHGTATIANDEAEAAAYAAWCPTVPITAWKDGLGHSLGACGLSEVALAAEAWCHAGGRIPGLWGNPQAGTRAPLTLLPAGEHQCAGPWLSTNAGFGGINGAVLLGALPATRVAQPQLVLQSAARSDVEVDADGRIPRLSATQVTGVIDASWGRMDRASRALVALGHRLGPWPINSAVILVSANGCAETDLRFERSRLAQQPDWQAFAYTLPTAPIGEASIRLGLHGPGMALVGATDEQARASARRLLAEGAPAVFLARIETTIDGHGECAWGERLILGEERSTVADLASDLR